jgi:TusA-related sulfurtransferase
VNNPGSNVNYGQKSLKATNMVTTIHLELECLVWPLSVLQFNQAVQEMQPGEKITATLHDGSVVENLQVLLKTKKGYSFEVDQTETGYFIHVSRRGRDCCE